LLNLYKNILQMKLLFASLLTIAVVASFIFAPNSKTIVKVKQVVAKPFAPKKPITNNTTHIKKYGEKLKPFLSENNYSEEICFLVDMKIPSRQKRFFIYDLQKDSILNAGLVTHGSGSSTKTNDLVFNNIPNGNATSLGKYKIGVEYSGKFGMAFKLHGLEASNNKAFERFVVLHSHSCVPAQEIDPFQICESLGCPTVSPAFLPTLKKYIDEAKKPVVLWIFY
jgi:L,D-transpeptidase catalytic domain